MKLLTNALLTLVAASLLPATAIANRPDAPGIKARIDKIYKPYKRKADNTAWWQYPVYSAETRKLIRQWEAAQKGGNEELAHASDADWLCDCQDFDPKTFRVTVNTVRVLPSGKTEAFITVYQGWNDSSKQRLIMVNEKGRWEIDDILTIGAKEGMKAALREDLAALAKRK